MLNIISKCKSLQKSNKNPRIFTKKNIAPQILTNTKSIYIFNYPFLNILFLLFIIYLFYIYLIIYFLFYLFFFLNYKTESNDKKQSLTTNINLSNSSVNEKEKREVPLKKKNEEESSQSSLLVETSGQINGRLKTEIKENSNIISQINLINLESNNNNIKEKATESEFNKTNFQKGNNRKIFCE
ncbi:hypothetical protein Mgra_00002511 [Meloidogyne graminicola]|uniref:Transmembrane protein n=1 Tax=Meloidogyne graminicola TaxID=189291 RepID=A0A8S9ZXN7_9BILA|nr:hypothetical protein Mgra_00002511 [Meloidogyne graminicola]